MNTLTYVTTSTLPCMFPPLSPHKYSVSFDFLWLYSRAIKHTDEFPVFHDVIIHHKSLQLRLIAFSLIAKWHSLGIISKSERRKGPVLTSSSIESIVKYKLQFKHFLPIFVSSGRFTLKVSFVKMVATPLTSVQFKK